MVSMLLFVDVYNFFHVANVLLFCVFILLYITLFAHRTLHKSKQIVWYYVCTIRIVYVNNCPLLSSLFHSENFSQTILCSSSDQPSLFIIVASERSERADLVVSRARFIYTGAAYHRNVLRNSKYA